MGRKQNSQKGLLKNLSVRHQKGGKNFKAFYYEIWQLHACSSFQNYPMHGEYDFDLDRIVIAVGCLEFQVFWQNNQGITRITKKPSRMTKKPGRITKPRDRK